MLKIIKEFILKRSKGCYWLKECRYLVDEDLQRYTIKSPHVQITAELIVSSRLLNYAKQGKETASFIFVDSYGTQPHLGIRIIFKGKIYDSQYFHWFASANQLNCHELKNTEIEVVSFTYTRNKKEVLAVILRENGNNGVSGEMNVFFEVDGQNLIEIDYDSPRNTTGRLNLVDSYEEAEYGW